MRAASTSTLVLEGLGPGCGLDGKKQVIMKARRPKEARQRKKPSQPPEPRTDLLKDPTKRLLMISLVKRNP